MRDLATRQGAKATDSLSSGRDIALALAILTALLGLVAAVAVSRGIAERQREFL